MFLYRHPLIPANLHRFIPSFFLSTQTSHFNPQNPSLNPNPDLIFLCFNSKSIVQTKQTHAHATLTGLLPSSVSLSASLILSYANFFDFSTSRDLFERSLPYCDNAYLWNTFMRALSTCRVDDEFSTYNRMLRTGVSPDGHTFPFALKACADLWALRKGMEIHGSVIKYGFGFDVFVGNTLLAFYGKCGDFWDARKVFDGMRERDVVSWNTVVRIVSDNEYNLESLYLFRDMNLGSTFKPNMVTIVTVLPVCGKLGDHLVTRQIHCYTMKAGLDSQVSIGNAFVDTYGKCGNVKDSKRVFTEMVEKNEVTWNTLIKSLVSSDLSKDALHIFRFMINSRVKPDSVTISSILALFVELEYLKLGKEIHGFCLRMGFTFDVYVENSLINMYAKSGRCAEASHVFQQMRSRDVVSWNAMVSNFAQNGLEVSSVELLREMQRHNETPDALTLTNVLPACARAGFLRPGKEIHAKCIRTGSVSDLFVSNALMDMYAKCDYIDGAQNIFDISVRDKVSYNILITCYGQTRDCLKSLALFKEMELVGIEHDAVSFMRAIAACADLAAIKQGTEIHGASIRKHFFTHIFVANSLLDFYTKYGKIDTARKIFDWIQNKDVGSWNCIILGYGMLGDFETAVNLFQKMREDSVEQDSVSYLAVLSACSHGRLVEKGKNYFEEMLARDIKPTQTHYACMVDLFGRAGLIEEAVGVIKSMPCIAGTDVWGALLGACRMHGNLELASSAEQLLKLEPQNSGYYTLLSNMYTEAGKWDDAKRVRDLMRSRGTTKNPGFSWVSKS